MFSFRNREGIPVAGLVLIGIVTTAFSALGSLSQIAEFGSILFLLSYAVTNWTALRLRDETGSGALIPALGPLGARAALPPSQLPLNQ